MNEAGKLLVAAISGGVDSTVAASLMLDAGYRVHGVTLRLKDALTAGQCGGDPESEARISAIAGRLGITHEFLDCAAEFQSEILEYSWGEYAAGRTPNPCAMCNRRIKFGLLADYARGLGAAGMITGHYAGIAVDAAGNVTVTAGRDPEKNQVYFLALTAARDLAFARTPLGSWRKSAVRAEAVRLGVAASVERESQDACFTFPGESFPESLAHYFRRGTPPGEIVDTAGRVLGTHRGLYRYTIGQRKGLEVALGRPAYVVALDTIRNQVVLSTEPGDLECRRLELGTVNFLAGWEGEGGCLAQFRYRQQPFAATLKRTGETTAELILAAPRPRPAAGQVAAFFDGARLLGGGIITGVA